MARKAIYKHATPVDASAYPDDGSSPVGTTEWNENPDPEGMIGCTPATANSSTIIIASGVATITDSVSVIAAESSTSDTLDKVAITNTNQYDLVYLFADTGDTITLTNTSSPSVDGHVKTVTGANETLSETVPTILMRKGNYWYGYGGGSTTPTDITVADTTDTTCFPALFESATGDLAPKTDAGLSYNAGTGMLTATGLTGPLTGNASTVTTNANLTGDVTSSGNATTIATDAVDIAMLSATGTADSSTYLRGDNTWAAAGGHGTQQFWCDGGAFVPTPSSTVGTATSYGQTRVLSNGVAVSSVVLPKNASIDSRCTFTWTPPKNWDNGTIKAKIYWTMEDTTTTSVGDTGAFEVAGVAVSNDDTLNASFGTAVAVTDVFLATNDLHVATISGAITVGGSPADADFVQLRINRNAGSDTLENGSNVELLGIILEYTQDASTSSG